MRAAKAKITLSLWHGLSGDIAQRLLFEEFAVDGELMGVLDAIPVLAARGGRTQVQAHAITALPPAERAALTQQLEAPLQAALRTALGRSASPMVLRAWSEGLRHLVRQLTRG